MRLGTNGENIHKAADHESKETIAMAKAKMKERVIATANSNNDIEAHMISREVFDQ